MRTDSLPPQAANVLEAVLYRGELPRGEVAGLVGTGDRQARRIVNGRDKDVLIAGYAVAFQAALVKGKWS